MALAITQHPLYTLNPVSQEVIFTVLDEDTVADYYKVKYIAKVSIDTVDINLATSTPVGTFKTTPNNSGAGIFDFRPIIESYVSSDNLAALGSSFRATATSDIITHPLPLVDEFSKNETAVRYLKIRFEIEGSSTSTGNATVQDTEDSVQYTLINGYLKHSDVLDRDATGNFGFDTEVLLLGGAESRFLTNAPLTQYANADDYGTISFMATPLSGSIADTTISYIRIRLFDEDGITVGSIIQVDNIDANGGNTTWDSDTKNQLLHFGCFPANLRNSSVTFAALYTLAEYYTVQSYNVANTAISDKLTIYLNCPTKKGFEPIRLQWLNQWGGWDYYTFTMKSTKTISTKGSTYQQLSGTWNDSIYSPSGYKGGKKAFRVNATEKVSMNTDFVNEAEAEWFEELINSPEVYMLDGYSDTDESTSSLNQYVKPVRLTTSNFTRKTVANDKLIQYTFEVEKSKTLRTQSI